MTRPRRQQNGARTMSEVRCKGCDRAYDLFDWLGLRQWYCAAIIDKDKEKITKAWFGNRQHPDCPLKERRSDEGYICSQ